MASSTQQGAQRPGSLGLWEGDGGEAGIARALESCLKVVPHHKGGF